MFDTRTMYWSESWNDQSTPEPPESDGDTPTAKPDGGGQLLDKILDQTEAAEPAVRLIRIKFPTPAFESRFKSCLAKVRLTARIEGEGRNRALLLRPENIRYFDDLVRTSGLVNCVAAMRAVNFLKMNANGFLRFETR